MSPDRLTTEAAEQLRLACGELERRLCAGEPCRAEEFFATYPALAEHADAALELIYTEFIVRRHLGQRSTPEEWLARFPRWQDDLRQLFEVHHLAGDTVLGSPPPCPSSAPADSAPRACAGLRRSSASGAGTGRRLGAYELLEEIGHGGMGVVYKARQAGLGRVVALKLIRAGEHAGAAELVRFQAEAEAIARLSHPNIVQVYEVGEQDGQPFFSLELVEGGSLDQKLAGKPWPARPAAQLIETLAGAVQHAHERGVVHRDLKPANVLLASSRRASSLACPAEEGKQGCLPYEAVPKITDFGLAKLLEGGPGLTPTEAILGTPSYMAPEQARGRTKEVGPAADCYALGAILYECLTGRPPFQAESSLDALQQVLSEEPVSPRRLVAGLPRDLEVICLKCLEKDAKKRYGSAAALADDLQRFLASQPIRARPPGALYRFGKFAGRHKAAVAGVASVFLALVVGIVGTSVGLARARQEAERARRAEGEARQLLAESFVRTGELAMRRGDWRTALDNFAQALDAGHPDSARLRLLEVRAWCALHELPRAIRQLEALARRDDLGELEGSVLLWRADIALGKSLEEDRALELVRRALRKGLSPAEEAYARGLLAETSSEAVEQIRLAVQRDPFHPRANAMLVLLLLALGKLSEAREQVTVAERLFPEDPTFRVWRAQVCALEGNMPGARAALKRARLGPRQMAAARALMALFHQAHGLGPLLGDPNLDLLVQLRIVSAVTRALLAVRALDKAGKGDAAALLLPLPPVLLRTLRSLAPLLPPRSLLFGGSPDQLVTALQRAVRVNPHGVLYLALGLKLAERGRWTEADQAFAAATTTPSLIPVEQAARFGAAGTAWALAGKGAKPNDPRRARAVQRTRALLARGDLKPGQAELLSRWTLLAGELDLAREISVEWERRAPEDLAPVQRRLAVEMAAGEYGPAIKIANRILLSRPRDAEAHKQRALAIAGLRKQVEALAPGVKGRPD
jgi:tetratricopeptide (TPR) repeat protein